MGCRSDLVLTRDIMLNPPNNLVCKVYITHSCMFFRADIVGFSVLQSPLLGKSCRPKSLPSSCALCVPDPVSNYSCKSFSNRFLAHENVKCLLILLLLFSFVTLSPGRIDFGFVNCCCIRFP